MKFSTMSLVLRLSAVTALLAGCAPSQIVIGTPSARSWILPEETGGHATLLYAPDETRYTVSVYDYKTGNLVGTLDGFDGPAGGCVDAAGNVLFVNQGNATILEFANAGTEPIHHYQGQPGWSGVGCSVNRHGDLAVAFQPLSSGPANICVWKAGRKSSMCYSDNDCGTMGAPGYDATGNVYVEGYSHGPAICELPAGAGAMKTVALSGGNGGLGTDGAMWDGKYLTLGAWSAGSSKRTSIYRVVESASGDLTVVGSTVLDGACNSGQSLVNQPFIVGTKNTPVNDRESHSVVGADAGCSAWPIDFWRYRAGGSPTKSWTVNTFTGGVVVSIGTHA